MAEASYTGVDFLLRVIETLNLPFSAYGRSGEVHVEYGQVDNPSAIGFDALRLPFDISVSIGYPWVRASVRGFASAGYRGAFCWVQLVHDRFYDQSGGLADEFVCVDAAPYLLQCGVPFFAYGYVPELFDSPCFNLGDHARLEWVADTFLTTMPSRMTDGTVEWLAGFRWGYVESRTASGCMVAEPIAPKSTDASVWNSHLPQLNREFPKCKYALA